MATNKDMFITRKGLEVISRELLNKRKFQENLITKVGLPFVSPDGIANSLDNENFFKHAGLSFSFEDKVTVKFKGSYLFPEKEDDSETLWSFIGPDVQPLSLVIFKNRIALMYGTTEIGTFIEEEFKNKASINIKVSMHKDKYEVVFIYNNKYNIISGTLKDTILMNKYSVVNVGVSPLFSPWLSDLDLSEFIIYKGDEDYYAPSTEPQFHFTKIMISNGNLPLTDSSVPIINNVYEFPISEINRTGNTLLLLSRIDSDVFLNIREIGLYSSANEGQILFSKITGLAIKKNKDLGYGLLFNVDLDLAVVNTKAMPEIKVYKEDITNQKDFFITKRVHTYITTDMERIINMNAKKLGLGRSHKISDSFNNLKMWTENNRGTQNYLKLDSIIRTKEERTFDKEKISKRGEVVVSDNGQAYNFSKENFVEISDITSDETSFNYEVTFETFKEKKEEQTVLKFEGDTIITPLTLSVINNKAFLKMSKKDTIKVYNSPLAFYTNYGRSSSDDAIPRMLSTKCYAWTNKEDFKLFNSHVSTFGEISTLNGLLEGFSKDNYAKTTPLSFNKRFLLKGGFSKSDGTPSDGVLFSGETNYSFKISVNTENRLTYQIGDGTKWLNTGAETYGEHFLIPNESYIIKVSFDGKSTYEAQISLEKDDIHQELDWSFSSTSLIPDSALILGQDKDHSKVWNGSMNLMECSLSLEDITEWTGGSLSKVVMTKSINPKGGDLFDIEGYPLKGSSIIEVTSGLLINKELIKIDNFKSYNFKISYKNSEYCVKVAVEDEAFKELYSLKSSEQINPILRVYFGSDPSIGNPLDGKISLDKVDLISGSFDYSPVTKITEYRNLKDFYYFTSFPFSLYSATNLKDPNRTNIEFFEGALTGNRDNIDFNNNRGFTLCTKFFLKDGSNKIIIAKVNKDTNEKYMVLKFFNNTLSFELFGEEGVIRLKKDYVVTTFRQITDYPTTIIITYDGDPYNSTFKMYKNRDLLDTYEGPSYGFLKAQDFSITNYLDMSKPSEVNCVSNIISFEGALKDDEIALVTNLLDTNF